MAKNTASSQRNPGSEGDRGDQGRGEARQLKGRDGGQRMRAEDSAAVHAHRTAKVVELVCSSTESFQDALECGLKDASATTRGITGAHVNSMSVKCRDGKIVEYKVDLKVAFGVERTPSVDSAR